MISLRSYSATFCSSSPQPNSSSRCASVAAPDPPFACAACGSSFTCELYRYCFSSWIAYWFTRYSMIRIWFAVSAAGAFSSEPEAPSGSELFSGSYTAVFSEAAVFSEEGSCSDVLSGSSIATVCY